MLRSGGRLTKSADGWTISTRQTKLGLKMEVGVEKGWERFASGGGGASARQRPPPTSLINETVEGREKDKNDIIDLLLKDEVEQNNFGVLPIVGIGGTAKTMLAQLICKHESIIEHFDLGLRST